MHVPKAAGTTVIDQIEFYLRPKRSEYWLDQTQFGNFDRFDTMSANIRSGIIFNVDQINTDTDVLMGHMGLTTFEKKFPEAYLATIVREPIMRLVSQWLYNRTYDDERAALYGDWGSRIAFARLPLHEFVCKNEIFCLIDNTLTRMLLWPHPFIPNDDTIEIRYDDILYREAIKALDRFDYIDTAENENLVERFCAWLQSIPKKALVSQIKTYIGDHNTNAKKNSFKLSAAHKHLDIESEITKARHLLETRTRIDRKLWENIVSQRLEKSVETFRHRAWRSSISRYKSSNERVS
jgi:ribosomal protein S24E